MAAVALGGAAWWYSVERGDAAPAKAQSGAQQSGAQQSGAQRGGPKAVPVTVVAVEQRAAPVLISTVGRVQTLASVAVRSRIDGIIASVSVTDGQEVKAGDELFRIDDREVQATLKQAQANLARDQAQLSNAKREVDRLTPLAAKNYTTRQTYDTAGTTVETLQATIAADQAAIDAAKVTLSYTQIRAPIAGRTGTVTYKLGSSVRSADSTPLVTINQLQPILVAFSISQDDMGALQRAIAAGAVPVTATIPDSSVPPQQGKVSYIENAIDPATNTLSVKAEFPNADEFLWPSQFVNVVMTLSVDPEALVVPTAAVQIGQEGSYVWVLKPDQTVEMRAVKVARQLGDDTVLGEGVTAGEQVVTEGQLRLEPGSAVEVTPATGPESSGTPSGGNQSGGAVQVGN